MCLNPYHQNITTLVKSQQEKLTYLVMDINHQYGDALRMDIPPNNIKALRKARKLTLAKLEAMTGITAQQINRLEKGERQLNDSNMALIAKALGCRREDLISEDALADEKTDNHNDDSHSDPLSHSIGEDDARLHYVDASLLAEALECVEQVVAEQGLKLTAEQKSVAVANTYSESEKFAEKPTRSSASMAIRLLDKGRDNGRDMETEPR
jgi:transcriptional regulator with XRE-family HTH domain